MAEYEKKVIVKSRHMTNQIMKEAGISYHF